MGTTLLSLPLTTRALGNLDLVFFLFEKVEGVYALDRKGEGKGGRILCFFEFHGIGKGNV